MNQHDTSFTGNEIDNARKSFLKRDRMRFTKNKTSAYLAYLAILLNVLYFVSIYSVNVNFYYSISIGASVVYNLLFLLSAFLCSEGVKNYKLSFAAFIIAIGAMQIARIFYIPLKALNSTYTETVAGVQEPVVHQVMKSGQFIYVTVLLSLSAACCIISGIITIIRENELSTHNRELAEKGI